MKILRWKSATAYLAVAGIIISVIPGNAMRAQQIAIPRIDQMSALPSPYLMRDWKQVARGYDSLVFNTALQGEYLPLSKTYTASTNYPGIQTFALQSYVGSSLNTGEGINCIPAVVGATLAGIDKSNQGGVNWVQMCREWFNKANGANVYFNAPSGSAGDDWWYDTMPNVFFYQLYSQYPNSPDFGAQFIAVADRWLAALHVLGASTAPWSIANVNHQAFNILTMKPVDASWVEPEAAGAIAWLLYQAYVVTGDQRYREGAELAMESLLVYTTNPSYELQLPYGVSVAARMNAELGTTYDLNKMLNWCFSNGDGTIRQWGVTVGTWGGYDCSGLIGEINHSNDYPFFMNGVEQAGALAPVVRYDDRYARAIGKWLLHLANASRLFYTNYLPDDHQDSYVWGHQYDPDSWIAHESLRQFKPSNSAITPYLTGDAIQGGWAPTNFALYGASHVGILAGLIDTTDVPMILRIDLLKTDYFHAAAYPTYLLYNPYSSDTTVALEVGQGTYDVYNTVTKQFIARGVSGSASIVIPADGAAVAVLTPAGGTVSYQLDQTLVNGVVVDYRSGRAVADYPPRIKGLAPVLDSVIIGGSTDVYCTATDRDGDSLAYSWTASSGTLTGAGRVVHWTAPGSPGSAVLRCTVSDGKGGEASMADTVPVIQRTNAPPVILRFNVLPRKLNLGGVSTIECVATDADQDSLHYSWSDSAGSITDTGRVVHWTAPGVAGDYAVTCTVSDGYGGSTSGTTKLEVRDLSITQSGHLIAYYPFNGNAVDATGNGHDGTVNGALLVADRAGNPNSAYTFNGTSSSIVVPNDSSLNFQKSLTVNLWMTVHGFYSSREQYVISHGNWQDRWKLSISPVTNKLRLTVKNTQGGIKDLDGESSLAQDSLYNVTGIYDGTELELYLNGHLDAFAPFSGSINTTTTALTVGQDLPGDNNYDFNGTLDDIRLYDYALSLNEIGGLVATSVEDRAPSTLPATTVLEQNYPNPFNPTTTIRYFLGGVVAPSGAFPSGAEGPLVDNVKLEVYDILGRKVATLADGRYPPGEFSFTFDASGLASGVYFYRMTAGAYTAVRKMILVR